MKNTIAFYERIQSEGERATFQDNIKEKGIELFHNWNSLSKNIPTVLFFHDSQKADLLDRTKPGEPPKPELLNTWLIGYSGYDTIIKSEKGKLISIIKFSDLQQRLTEVIEQISNLSPITIEKLENIIFGFDPKLEELLAPFASSSPYEITNKQKVNLKDAKNKLQSHVNKYLKKQN